MNAESPNLGLNGQQAPDRLVTAEGNSAHKQNIHEMPDLCEAGWLPP
jgi:hypothetical protein